MNIAVTKEDIRRGRRNSPWACPIARACRRVGIVKPSVVCEVTSKPKDQDPVTWDLPGKAIDFINDFDMKKPVKPIKFRISRRKTSY